MGFTDGVDEEIERNQEQDWSGLEWNGLIRCSVVFSYNQCLYFIQGLSRGLCLH